MIDKETFAVVEYNVDGDQLEHPEVSQTVNFLETSYRFRPYQGKYVLKDFMRRWNTLYLDKKQEKHEVDVNINMNVIEFRENPFLEFNNSLNEKMDIRKSLID